MGRNQGVSFILVDQKILLTVQRWRKPILNRLFVTLTQTGTGKFWFVFAFIVNVLNIADVKFVEQQQQFLRSMFAPLIAWIIGSWIKKLVSRGRPSEAISGYLRIIESPTCGSFPSSHTAAAVAFYASLQLNAHPSALVVSIWAFLISFSRLYLGVHYLSDILGGALLGTVIAFILGSGNFLF